MKKKKEHTLDKVRRFLTEPENDKEYGLYFSAYHIFYFIMGFISYYIFFKFFNIFLIITMIILSELLFWLLIGEFLCLDWCLKKRTIPKIFFFMGIVVGMIVY